jgi:N-methylhydantoinase B
MTARGLERFVFRPYGLRGGKPGALFRVRLNPGTPRESTIGKIDLLTLDAGDVVEFEGSSGGGFGDPLDRDPELVLTDIQSGLVSVAQADSDYGVVVRNGAVDVRATEKRRADRPAPSADLMDVGPERRAYELIWSDEVVSEMIRLLAVYPTRLRPVLRNRVRAWVERQGRPIEPTELAAAVSEVANKMGLKQAPAEAAVALT